MDSAKVLLDKTLIYVNEYREIERLLLAPEITADIQEVKKLSQRSAFLEPIVKERTSLEVAYKDLNNCAVSTSERKFLIEEVSFYTIKLVSRILSDRATPIIVVEAESDGDRRTTADVMEAYRLFVENAGYKTKNVENGFEIYDCPKSLVSTFAVGHKVRSSTGSVGMRILAYPKIIDAPVNISKQDLRIDVFLSHGKGGQNINKVETAIRVTYLPENIVVTCQDERSQLENKKRALEKLEAILKTNQREKTAQSLEKARNEARVKAGEYLRTIDFKADEVEDKRTDIKTSAASFSEGDIFELTASILTESCI